ncbi:hypothetical protein E6C27_scaffold34G002170 [Cucumis melo var. makuwa]|uniref:CACTA en-spm transposon protein n=1 Tax=Cucumis melo var. makuwa TaxID=1194695 RepID=A0A5A7SKY5_CUCMM|nr:hypothetical protein E6C27_scaffold34G002170 [Cucumis melo var. makuwa]
MSHDLFSLVMGPHLTFDVYNGCIIGGVRFHTMKRDSRHNTQNSGVMVIGESSGSGSSDSNFYGVLEEVLDVQYSIGRRVWLYKLEDVENEQLNVLEIIFGHRVDEHIEDDTLCKPDVDPIVVERLIVHHVAGDFIDDDDEQLGTMPSFLSGFKETDAQFLEFEDQFNNVGGSSSMGDN